MSINEREYMARPDNPAPDGMDEGVVASSQQHAEQLLHFACPTQAANGKWYRTTIAVTNVPVAELYNVLSNANFIAKRLRDIAASLGDGEAARAVLSEAAAIERLRELLRQRDRVGSKAIVLDDRNIHANKKA